MKALSLAAVVLAALGASPQTYFDAHNHITGVLPYVAYANPSAFAASLSDPARSVSEADRLALFRYLADQWYPSEAGALDDRLFSPPQGQRFALGARATLVVYGERVATSPAALDGALERMLTATPWTEFDSAYAFRGGPVATYLTQRFYAGDRRKLEADLCRATVLDLAATHIDVSEQSLPFIGGWAFRQGDSDRLDTIECAMDEPSNPVVVAALRAMHRPAPLVKVVLMTHTSQLATLPGGTTYSEWSQTGQCAATALPAGLITTPKTIYDALMGWDRGRLVVPAWQAKAYFDTVVGIDTAGPETTCFTPAGMTYYEQLAGAVYRAAKDRRRAGWHGKLLVHTHVGEGGVVDFAPDAPPQPWNFGEVFGTLPTVRSNAGQARQNITTLLAAIAAFERAHPDAANYVVFRLAHDTWATPEQARAMHDERVEADVNLESNVATGAYPISRMPLGAPAILKDDIDPIVGNVATNFELNDLLAVLVKDPSDVDRVGAILGNASLKYLLEARVRCLLGTDADGVEHSDIVKEYRYAASLIAYWNRTDPSFHALSGGADERRLFENVDWHLATMASDSAAAY